jgi:hypothetical protein
MIKLIFPSNASPLVENYRWNLHLRHYLAFSMYIPRESITRVTCHLLLKMRNIVGQVLVRLRGNMATISKISNQFEDQNLVLCFFSSKDVEHWILCRYHLKNIEGDEFHWVTETQNIASCVFVADYLLRVYW